MENVVRAGLRLAGRYHLRERLGAGAMGEVWRADDERLGRPVAVKLLLGTDAELIRRFRREAAIAARLRHPGITTVHDFGVHGERMFLVMELLEGDDLRTVLDRAPTGLDVGEAVALAAQAARALAAAHARHVVHRDLKPANLFLQTDGLLKVCDFGIARAADASQLTGDGDILGTPAYMSPEQCRGERVDARSDLYSLGCVLYALLTGRPPFPVGAGPLIAVMNRHLHEVPDGPRVLRPELPAELDDLVTALLAKPPEDRPADAAAVATRLDPLASAPPRAGSSRVPPSTGDRGSVARLLDDAEAIARALPPAGEGSTRPDEDRAVALAEVATGLAMIDPARTDRLIDDAEGIARAIGDDHGRDTALARIAELVADVDTVRAERIARAVTSPVRAVRPMRRIVVRTAAGDPERAERIAAALDDHTVRAAATAAVAEAVAASDPEHAERLIRGLDRPDEDVVRAIGAMAASDLRRAARTAHVLHDGARGLALAWIATTVASGDPAEARTLVDEAARSVRESARREDERAERLLRIAGVIAEALPERARALVDEAVPSVGKSMVARLRGRDRYTHDDRLLRAATAMVRVDPARAEKLAGRITDAYRREAALAEVAGAMAGVDIERAERIARDIDRETLWHDTFAGVVARFALVAPARAERMTWGFDAPQGPGVRGSVLAEVAEAIAHAYPGRGEQLARAIDGDAARVTGLVRVALASGGSPASAERES